jgi:hypothetical protein
MEGLLDDPLRCPPKIMLNEMNVDVPKPLGHIH